ncbi:MAG: ATP-binding protein [Thermomicrobiales bacterium]
MDQPCTGQIGGDDLRREDEPHTMLTELDEALSRVRTVPSDDWRESAIDEGLQAVDENSTIKRAVLRAIRRARPGAATLMLGHGPERKQLLRFLETQGSGYRSLLGGTDSSFYQGYVHPFLGWYETYWKSEPIEIVFLPTGADDGSLIAIGRDVAILRDCLKTIEAFTNRPSGRCLRYSYRWENAPDLEAEVNRVDWDDIVLPGEIIADLRKAVEGFFRQREIFSTLGFGWRRGILLVGPPGTGKTMVCKAAAHTVPTIPFLYVRDFHQSRGEAIQTIFERARRVAPCILAFEDIDGLVGLGHRTVFLNELDGFQNNDGLLIIASSNHPEQIDEALLKRPSRFDRVVHIGLPGPDERREFCQRILHRPEFLAHCEPSLDRDALAEALAEQSDGFTLAYLKEVFTGAALNRAEAGATSFDAAFSAAALEQVAILQRYLRGADKPNKLIEWREPANGQLGFHPVRPLPGR